MARGKKRDDQGTQQDLFVEDEQSAGEAGGDGDDVVLEGKLVCALTGEHRTSTPQEELLQSFIEQLHREYSVALADMERDVRIQTEIHEGGRTKQKTRTASLAVFEANELHSIENITHVVIVAKPGTKTDQKAIVLLEEMLGGLNQNKERVYGVWTNGQDMAFRMRTYDQRNGEPVYTELTDMPGPDETLDELEDADRRPLRVAAGDSLLRTFKYCHDYLYGNQNMRGDRAFWQLLYLIFAKILDERGSAREFFVGATERNSDAGQRRIAERIKKLFGRVKDEYQNVFDGSERIELNDRALAFVAAEISRYHLLGTDTDAKGMAYEAITSTTLKRERGQFFTPRNVIRMMVEMVNPEPDKKVLDPACGSGGFLVVALAHMRRRLLAERGCEAPEAPLPSELKKVEPSLKKYAERCLYGIDVDPELRKAAKMNMVMNNDGHGNIHSFNSLELGVEKLQTDEMRAFVKKTGGFDAFDYVFTNPPFGAKIPVEDPDILATFDLGHTQKKAQGAWSTSGVEKKVPPEILFIEACYKFLKPGTGVMGIVLPNGILGNPGEKMELVRHWMLKNMELLASVDLPAEAFLPQVSVQASCVFLRKRHLDEHRLAGKEGIKQRPVFMAIAEKCGHGRRGETTYERNPDGTEVVVTKSVLERTERRGKIETVERMKQVKVLADDMPWVAEEYQKHVGGAA